MPHRLAQQRIGPSALARTLAWLRLCAIAGQSIAVLFCALWMRLAIPLLPLLTGIGLLAVFAALAAWRLRQSWPVYEWETIMHIAVDTAVLGGLLYFTGGTSNPFVTLLLVPIALGAAALPVRAILVVAVLCGGTYAALLHWYMPLPWLPHRSLEDALPLHMAGMAVNFVITALLLGFFINRLARALQLQQREVQRVRERALRDEGILAIATQAAGAAHELNTPLSTMLTLLPELRRDYCGNHALNEDLALLQEQVARCRGILRDMVSFGEAQLSQQLERLSVAAFVRSCLERFQLLCPAAELDLQLDDATGAIMLRTPLGLRHSLLNLLNNAAEASALRDSHTVTLQVRQADGWLELIVRDHGPGFDVSDDPTMLGQTRKQTGLGLGLTLAEATMERLKGELSAGNTDHGAEVYLRLPLTVIAEQYREALRLR